jgi:magnesium-transporting ATPase (P-type)
VAEGKLSEKPPESPTLEKIQPQLTFLGLAGFIDPLRPDVKESIQIAHNAGIDVIMITGDHPRTALTIARELDIAGTMDEVMTGKELSTQEKPSLPSFPHSIGHVRVFARVSPIQKMEIVDTLIQKGHYVAVTGDGVNDAPALKRAHIGIAMGTGTDVAKGTASMIITDDNFSSIVAGVEEGRFAYDNIRKVTYLLISTGFSEVILFILSLISGLPIPLLAIQLLWLNLVTNGIQGIALAFEAGEPGTMKRKPRPPEEGIFNRLMVKECLLSGSVIGIIAFSSFSILLEQGMDLGTARNLILLLMVLFENFHVFNCRSEYHSAFRIPIRNNYFLVFGVLVMQGLHIISLNIPIMQDILGTFPVTGGQWITCVLGAGTVLIVMELFKVVQRRGDNLDPILPRHNIT